MRPRFVAIVAVGVFALSCGGAPDDGAAPASTVEVVPEASATSPPIPSASAAQTSAPPTAAAQAPSAPSPRPPTGPASTEPPVAERVLASGDFQDRDYEGSGRAVIARKANGSLVLRFEDFSTQSGPSLRVWTSGQSWDAPGASFMADHTDVGPLKRLEGDQSYELPATIDVGTVRSVVIWCERFQAPFIAAGL